MKRRVVSEARLRLAVWVVGAALCTSYYFVSVARKPIRTPVGVERRLFGLGSQPLKMMESPSGGQWILVPDNVDTFPARKPSGALATIWQRVRSFQWPGSATTSRQLTPFQVSGTWLMERDRLRWIWHYPASGWVDDYWLRLADPFRTMPFRFDLRNCRTVRGRWPDTDIVDEQREDYSDESEPPALSALSSALEELPAISDSGYERYSVGQRRIFLMRTLNPVHTLNPANMPTALYSVSDEFVPRVVPLTVNASPLALSHDGRTLFFERNRALWRLELRKPLPALLDEKNVPDLPDPLAAPQRMGMKAAK
jgi:hypothetical protein